MVVVGADVHKRTHTFVAVDEVGRQLGQKVVVGDHVRASRRRCCWARDAFGAQLVWGDRGLPASVGAPGARSAHCWSAGGAGAAEVDGANPDVGAHPG